MVKAMDKAQSTIFVSAYLLSQHRIVRALERASAQGVHVYVMLERQPFGIVQQPQTMFSLLQAARISVRWSPPYFRYSHAKFMVLDDRLLILSSANFTQAGFSTDRDFVLFDRSGQDVREADNTFRSDWDRIRPVLDDHDLLVSPSTARAKLYSLIARAKHTLDLYSEEVLDRGTVRRLGEAARHGVRVRILAATVSVWATRYLKRAGVRLKSGAPSGSRPYIHAKVIVADRRLAFIGSENISATSLDQNRELGVVVAAPSVIQCIESTFARDWRTD